MTTAKLARVGNSVAVVLPPEVLTRLNLDEGDVLYVVETACGVELTPNADHAGQMDLARAIMSENRTALARLAK